MLYRRVGVPPARLRMGSFGCYLIGVEIATGLRREELLRHAFEYIILLPDYRAITDFSDLCSHAERT
jgi:hypothetical protein